MASAASPPVVIADDYQGFPKDSFCLPGHFRESISNILIPGGIIKDRIERMALDIATDIGEESFTALCVLKGGYQFFSDLLNSIRQIYRFSTLSKVASRQMSRRGTGSDTGPEPDQFNNFHIKADFVRVKSYENDSSTGQVVISGIDDLSTIKDMNLLVVEDIIDTGLTMVKLLEVLKGYKPKSLRVASLFWKRNPKSCGYVPQYVGFNVPDKFIIGYNLDYNDYFRELNHVCIISEGAKRKFSVPAKESSRPNRQITEEEGK